MIYLFGSLVFFLLQAFFSASEMSFISSGLLKLARRQHKDERAKLAYQLISNPERFLATTLVGTNLSVVVSSTLATYFLIRLGITNSNLWITFLFTPVVVIFAELVPKNIGRNYREKLATYLARPFTFFQALFSPFVYAVEKVSVSLTEFFLGRERRRSLFVTKEEIKALIAEGEKEGVLEKGEKEAIEDVFQFRETKLKDVCIPLKEVKTLDYNYPVEKVKEIARVYKFTRYPVFKNKVIVGYLNIFDLFYRESKDWHTLIRPITHLGGSQRLYQAFYILKAKRESMAVVMKGKKSLGIVTLESLMREILDSIAK
ncbi:MAG: hypothetical protein DRP81_04790 [Candidatus Omnitrophota bacterium]|nr:MAG: hypothetical protein DRP81_04790 [Candidatus Omnitrophota bacterium]HDN85674.1 DUF21 domain-containing protein [Candidatus Omnitrophota bacterium]